MRSFCFRVLGAVALVAVLAGLPSLAAAKGGSFLNSLNPIPAVSTLTIPTGIGDTNPYGVAVVPESSGLLVEGDVLVSNFNSSSNLQGTGTTIIEITPGGQSRLFAQIPSAIGLTTALVVLRTGWVIVGNLPTTYNGTTPTAIGAGQLTVLDNMGQVVERIADSRFVDGPWDATVSERGFVSALFFSNVLNGTVVRMLLVSTPRIAPIVVRRTQIGSGYVHRPDPAALEVGPTGLALGSNGTLYVASTGDNAIYGIADAQFRLGDGGKGAVVYADATHLHGPLGLALAPNGNLLAAEGDAVNPDAAHPSEITEATPNGRFVAQLQVDSAAGGAFGLAVAPDGGGLYAVDDNTNTLNLYQPSG